MRAYVTNLSAIDFKNILSLIELNSSRSWSRHCVSTCSTISESIIRCVRKTLVILDSLEINKNWSLIQLIENISNSRIYENCSITNSINVDIKSLLKRDILSKLRVILKFNRYCYQMISIHSSRTSLDCNLFVSRSSSFTYACNEFVSITGQSILTRPTIIVSCITNGVSIVSKYLSGIGLSIFYCKSHII